MVEAINQGVCTECDSSDNNFSDQREYGLAQEEHDYIQFNLRCDCGAESVAIITTRGLVTVGPISHDDASWE